MNNNLDLFSTFQLGDQELKNRIIMAPMTRLRANDSIPTELMAIYYAQRASAGLIITECTMVSPLSHGYMNCPGIYNQEQIKGWQQVTEAVHDRGGKIFLQLWHSGRVAHSALLNGESPVAPSAIAGQGQLHTPIGKVDLETPRALETGEIPPIVQQFAQGAKNALEAGFDGIELHGAFGYLIDQFLQDGSNQRTDEYGGTVANRCRFVLDILGAVTPIWGAQKVGIKLSPSNTFYGMYDSNPQETFSYLLQQLNKFDLAYIHLMEPNEIDLANADVINPVLPAFKDFYQGTIMTNGGYDRETGNQVVASNNAQLVSYGKPFIANPDLPERFAKNAPLNEPNSQTFYGRGGENETQGYTDYPFLT